MNIILADDSRIARIHLAAVLVEAGHDVIEVDNGRKAWEAFERSPTPMVILDWIMPELDGMEVVRRIRSSPAGRDTFVLMITGRGTPNDVTSGVDAGVDDFVVKPITAEHLHARLIIAERRIAQTAAARRAENALNRARWLAGIGETVLTLQHEINNPLTAVLVEAEMLAGEPTMPARFVVRLREIVEQSERIAQVVKRLSAIEDPQVIERLSGVRMIDLSDTPAE